MGSITPLGRGGRTAPRRVLMLSALSIAAIALSACGSDSSPSDSDETNAPVDTTATLRISTTIPPLSLDPRTTATGVNPYQSLVWDRLLNTDEHANVVPMLATDWKFSDDGLSLVLTLRDDVKFHNGDPLDSAAVVTSLTHWKSDKGSLQIPKFANVASIEATDPQTVTLHLTKPDATLPSILTSAAGTVLSPKAFDPGVDLTNDDGDFGSAPWVVQSYTQMQTAVYVRASDPNWDTKAGQTAKIELDYSTDQNARLNAMQTNAADMAYINNGETYETQSLTDSGDYKLYKLPAGLQSSLVLNNSKPPFDDPKVRQAIKEAIDPDPIVNGLFKGDCTSTEGSIFLPDNWAYAKADDKYPYDLDNAKALLAQTSVAGGFTFTAITNQGGANAAAATVIQESLSKLGVTMNIKPLPQADVATQTAQRSYDASVALITSAADPGLTVSQNFLLPGGIDAAGDDSTELAALAGQALSPSLSQDDRAKLYQQANQLIADKVWTVPLCNISTPWLATSKVQGLDTMNWIPNFDPRYLAISK